MERLITTKPWWDTIDMLSQNPVAKIATEHPEVIPETINGWAFGDEMWLQRSAILFQLKYKQDTDEALLYRYIRENKLAKLSIREGSKYL